jgi:hypothetical protein
MVEGDQKRLYNFVYIPHMVYAFPSSFISLVLISLPKRLPRSSPCWPPLTFCGPFSLLLSLLLVEFSSAFSLNLVIILFVNQVLVVLLLFVGLGVVYMTRSLVIIRKTPPKHSLRIIIIPLFDAVRIISFINKSRDVLHATLSRDNNRSFVRKDHLSPLFKPPIFP